MSGIPASGPPSWPAGLLGAVFQEALELPADEAERHVRQRCGRWTDLAEEILRMLDEVAHVPSVLRRPLGSSEALAEPALERGARPAAPLPASFGPYRVVEALPAGGMGMVFRAERSDGVFDKTVAVKVMHPERTNAYALRLFHEERKILAALEHPNIVRILDGGDFGPRAPYFIMEHVDGVRVDEYCKRQRLKVRQRVELMRQVAEAVQYLHGKGVIHGDLKPSNILVTRDGTPKVLDFGIARFLQRPSPETAGEHETIGGHDSGSGSDPKPAGVSMAYASPETLRMEPLTPSSDIYSLGVVLYELLTGSRPAVVSWAQTTAPSQAPNPPQDLPDRGPASLPRSRRDELDHIVLRAIRFRAEDRYGSAAALAGDLRHHLAGDAVEAMGRSWLYLGRKHLARRRFAAVLAGATVAVSGVAFWAVLGKMDAERQLEQLHRQAARELSEATTRESLRQAANRGDAAQQKQDSEARARDVRDVSELVGERIHQSLLVDPQPRGDRASLARGLEQYLELLGPAAEDPPVARELGLGWVRLGDLWDGAGANLGNPENAIRAWNEAYRLASLWAQDPRYAGEVQQLIEELRERHGPGFQAPGQRP